MVLLAATTAIPVLLAGCDDKPQVASNLPSTSTAATACAEKLTASLEMLQPERLGISTDPATAVSQLNDWLETCDENRSAGAPLGEDVEMLLRPILSPARINRLSVGRFSVRDGEHARNCFLNRAIANLDTGAANGDLQRVVAVFHYLARNVAPPTNPDEALPLTPYQILLFGRGSAADLAWAFADVLRQLEIDAVILTPSVAVDGEDGEERRWLVGVLIGGEVYLFDPELGTPIPSLADEGTTPTVLRPATLADARTNDEVFRQLDLPDGPTYPLSAEDLRQLKVEVIGTASWWSSASQRLQAALTGNRSAVVYDGLQDDGGGPGLISRVSESGGEFWRKEDVGIWSYPERQLDASDNLDEEGRQRLRRWQVPLEAPVPVEFDRAKQQVVIGAPEKGQYKTRILHLLGDYRTAVGNYQKTRIRAIIDPRYQVPPQIRLMHALAEDDAFFWVGLCQFEQAHYDSAGSTFRDYIERYKQRPGGAWLPHCWSMLALSVAEGGDWGEAVFTIEEAELALEEQELAALRPRFEFWKRRWSAAAKKMNDQR